MIFERTIIYSLYDSYFIYFRMAIHVYVNMYTHICIQRGLDPESNLSSWRGRVAETLRRLIWLLGGAAAVPGYKGLELPGATQLMDRYIYIYTHTYTYTYLYMDLYMFCTFGNFQESGALR